MIEFSIFRNQRICLFFLLIVLFSLQSYAQTIPVGLLERTEDNFRRQQLLGNDSSGISFMIRPLAINLKNDLLIDKIAALSSSSFRKSIYFSPNQNSAIYILPLIWQQQVNTHHPYGMNDGAMIPARGYQSYISAGIYAKLGPLTLQFRPEYIYAENKKFNEVDGADTSQAFIAAITRYRSRIDAPDRFGTGQYSKLSWGQSSLYINWKSLTFGLSNENLWWGPGIRTSLLMSNNAAGFKHLTLNTNKPIVTPIGSFEAQLIAGRLDSSGVKLYEGRNYRPKERDWRYLSGIVFTYQPKWIPGLYFGANRSFTVNSKRLGSGFTDYFPIFSSVEKSSFKTDTATGINEENAKLRDQRISFFTRWILPESRSEIYLEFGKNDHNWDLRDLTLELEHARAYTAGFRQLIALSQKDTYMQVSAEITQLEIPRTTLIRRGDYWYAHGTVSHGYTQEGQVLGAGIGSGSNFQSLDVSWVRGIKRIGLQFERTVQNNDLFYEALINDYRRHWVDFSVTGKFDWNFNRIILNSQLAYIRSFDYQYHLEQDVNNFHVKIGLMYLW